jgi:hypothetical protein
MNAFTHPTGSSGFEQASAHDRLLISPGCSTMPATQDLPTEAVAPRSACPTSGSASPKDNDHAASARCQATQGAAASAAGSGLSLSWRLAAEVRQSGPGDVSRHIDTRGTVEPSRSHGPNSTCHQSAEPGAVTPIFCTIRLFMPFVIIWKRSVRERGNPRVKRYMSGAYLLRPRVNIIVLQRLAGPAHDPLGRWTCRR